jgi:hypothetical protein
MHWSKQRISGVFGYYRSMRGLTHINFYLPNLVSIPHDFLRTAGGSHTYPIFQEDRKFIYGPFRVRALFGRYRQTVPLIRYGARVGNEIFYTDLANNLIASRIRMVDNRVEVVSVRELFGTSKANLFSNALYDITPDGKRFIIVSTGGLAESPPLTFVVNWDSEIGK